MSIYTLHGVNPDITSNSDPDLIKASTLRKNHLEVDFNPFDDPDILNIFDNPLTNNLYLQTQNIFDNFRLDHTAPQSAKSNPSTLSSPAPSLTLEEWKILQSDQGHSGGSTDISNVLRKVLPYFNKITQLNTSSPFFGNVFNRWQQYQSLSPISQDLINLIYGDEIEFIRRPAGTGSPFDEYIEAFDRIMEDDSLVRALGFRIGIYVPVDSEYTARELFLDKLVEYINGMEKFGPDEAERHSGFPTTSQILDMTREKFKQLMDKYNITYSEQLYQDRLITFMQIYHTT